MRVLWGWTYHAWTRPAPTRRQIRNDVLIALAAIVISVGSVESYYAFTGIDLGRGGVEAYLWFALTGLLLVIRRLLPLTHLVLQSVLFVIIGERFPELATIFTVQAAMFASLYSAWAWARRPRALIAVTTLVLVAMFGWLLWSFGREGVLPAGTHSTLFDAATGVMIYTIALNIAYFAGAVGWGHVAWRGARGRAELALRRDDELRRLQAEQQAALRDERIRIARELHDVVAHHVSGIGVQAAGAARVLTRRPETAVEALDTIESSAREAVTSMHQLVGLLRSDDETESTAAGLADIGDLTAGSGLRVDHRVVGEPFDVPATVSHALYRIVQEALTNVRRHAGARSVRVVLRFLDDGAGAAGRAVEVEVTDDGRRTLGRLRSAGQGSGEQGGGFGLAGIRERTAALDGETEIGPRPDGGFRVRARMPVSPAAPLANQEQR